MLNGNSERSARSTYQGALVVEAEWRRQGMGQALLGHALTKVRYAGGTNLVIDDVSCSKDLRSLAAKFSAEFNFAEQDCQAWFTLGCDRNFNSTNVSSMLPVEH